MKILFIVNPSAGKGRAAGYADKLTEMFKQHGIDVTMVNSLHSGHAHTLAHQAGENWDAVVCAGGDGTIHEVASGLMMLDKPPALGYIPAGTTNDIAFNLGLPQNIMEAGKIIIDGRTIPMDIGKFQDDHFVYLASFGIFTDVPYSTPQNAKNAFGKFAYFAEGAAQLNNIKYNHAIIEHDGGIIEDDFVFLSVTNTKRFAGMINFDPEYTALDDGLFELLTIKATQNPFVLLGVFIGLLQNRYDPQYVSLLHTSKLKVISEESTSWCIDGENGGMHQEVFVENRNKGLNLIA